MSPQWPPALRLRLLHILRIPHQWMCPWRVGVDRDMAARARRVRALTLAQAERGNDDAAQKPPLLPHCRAFVANGQTTAALMVASKTRASVSSTSSPSHMLRCLLLPVLAAPKQRLMLGTLRCPRDQLKLPSKWTIEVHNWWAVGCQGVPVLIMNDNASNYVKPRL